MASNRRWGCLMIFLALHFLAQLNGCHCANIKVTVFRGFGLRPDLFSPADGFVRVYYNNKDYGRTQIIQDSNNPAWNQNFFINNVSSGKKLELKVYDNDLMFHDLLGTCTSNPRVSSSTIGCSLNEGGTVMYSYSVS
ncbi:perforin-1-like [Huso huso]|uniref:Perforin-1-like n=1 Tax=Huso huso TaxID=61971 RepID=A0ABR0YHS9_HUSHU